MTQSRSNFLKSLTTLGLGSCLMPHSAKAKENIPSTCFSEKDYRLGDLLYENNLAKPDDIGSFVLEGQAKISFPNGRMRMENSLDASLGQKSNFVFWCAEDFPSDIAVTWNFYPIHEPGLCILFFGAKGKNGKSIFDNTLAKRTGEYQQYHHGDINALHISYFRRRYQEERSLHLCNLRKSYGFHMVAQGADPIPSVVDAKPPYSIKLVKRKNDVALFIEGLPILKFVDNGNTYGPLIEGGKIGFRQMAPLIGEYDNLKVFKV